MHKIVHDVATGEILEIDLNKEELDELNKRTQQDLLRAQTVQSESNAKAAAKAALLTQLGITEEQAKLLLS